MSQMCSMRPPKDKSDGEDWLAGYGLSCWMTSRRHYICAPKHLMPQVMQSRLHAAQATTVITGEWVYTTLTSLAAWNQGLIQDVMFVSLEPRDTWVDAGFEASSPVAVDLSPAHKDDLDHGQLADGKG